MQDFISFVYGYYSGLYKIDHLFTDHANLL